MLDIVADEGWLSPALRIVLLLQMIVQARWINENSLLTLPGKICETVVDTSESRVASQ